jgi:hypothetical protein
MGVASTVLPSRVQTAEEAEMEAEAELAGVEPAYSEAA